MVWYSIHVHVTQIGQWQDNTMQQLCNFFMAKTVQNLSSFNTITTFRNIEKIVSIHFKACSKIQTVVFGNFVQQSVGVWHFGIVNAGLVHNNRPTYKVQVYQGLLTDSKILPIHRLWALHTYIRFLLRCAYEHMSFAHCCLVLRIFTILPQFRWRVATATAEQNLMKAGPFGEGTCIEPTFTWSSSAALSNGLKPASSTVLTNAPFSIRKSTISVCPVKAAQWRGVVCVSSTMFTGVPLPTSFLTSSKSPWLAATIRACVQVSITESDVCNQYRELDFKADAVNAAHWCVHSSVVS